jgi:hypothetical protein
MRLKIRSLWRAVKDDLRIEFVSQQLTSYGGLELFSRYFRKVAVIARLRRALAAIPNDYGSARLALLLVALFDFGARRLEHLRYLAGDPLLARYRPCCSLGRSRYGNLGSGCSGESPSGYTRTPPPVQAPLGLPQRQTRGGNDAKGRSALDRAVLVRATATLPRERATGAAGDSEAPRRASRRNAERGVHALHDQRDWPYRTAARSDTSRS